MAEPNQSEQVSLAPAAAAHTPAAPPAPTPAELAAAEYDIVDPSTVQSVASSGEQPPETVTPSPEAPRTPAKDPLTGRFIKADDAPQTFTHPAALVEMATDLGIPDHEISGRSTEELAYVIRAVQRAARDQARDVRSRQADDQELHQQTGKPAPGVNPLTPDLEGWDASLDDEAVYDTKLTGSLKATLKAMQAKIDQQQKVIEQLGRAEMGRIQLTVDQQIDAGFADLGDSFKSVFGDGSVHALAETSAERQRRNAIVRSLDPKAVKGNWRQAVKERAKLLYPAPPAPVDSNESPVPKKNGRVTQEQWDNAALLAPTNRRGAPEAFGRERAERAVADVIRERGIRTGEQAGPSGEASIDDFPE